MGLLSVIRGVLPGATTATGFAPSGNGVQGLEAGAGARRLARFRPSSAHVNTLIAAAGGTVRDRARWLARNNAYAINAVDWWASAAVGAGITPSWITADQGLKARLRQAWDDWTDEADAEGLTDLYGLQRRAVRELFIAGEVFFRLRYRRPEDGLSVPLQLQMLPSEMLDPGFNRVLPGGNVVRQGIEFDQIGRRVAYHFWRTHPADVTEQAFLAGQRTRVPAAEVLHLMDPVEAGQIRGLSRFSNVMVPLFTLDAYDDAELERKKTAALFAGFITRKLDPEGTDPAFGVPPADAGILVGAAPEGVEIAGLEAGTMQVLGDGEDVKFSEPADVGGSYEAFQYRTLLRIAVGLGTPYFALTGDMTKGNYGSNRSSSLDAKRRTEAFQWGVMVFGFCRPVIGTWLAQAALAGTVEGLTTQAYVRAPQPFRRIRWMPPVWEWIDPRSAMETDEIAVRNRFKARSDVIEANGYDAEETDLRISEDQKRLRRLGIEDAPAKGADASAPMEAAPQPEPVPAQQPAQPGQE